MVFRKIAPSFLAVLLCLLCAIPSGAAVESWVLQNAQLNDMTYGGGVYVAVGEKGYLLRSTDGETWVKVDAGVDIDFFAVAYGAGSFVATGDGGTVLTSPDGMAWTEQDPAVPPYAYDLVYAEGTFVGQSPSGYVYLSTDGVEWTEYDTGATYTQMSITYGNDLFVIVGAAGEILTSDNGSSGWTTQASQTNQSLFDITYSGTKFVAAGFNGHVVTSPDGVNWSRMSSGITTLIRAVGYGNGQFVATGGGSSADAGYVWTSPDGLTWTEQDSGIFEWLYNVEFYNNKYFITGGKIIASDDGVNWTSVHDATGWDVLSVAYGEGIYAAGTMAGTSIRSTDGGETWTDMTNSHDSTIGGIVFNPGLGLFFGVCADGQVLNALPADDFWTVTTHAVSTPLRDAAYDSLAGNTVMVGDGGTIAMINASDVLSTVTPVTTYILYGVGVSGSTYVAVGWGGTVIVSQDSGANWETTTPVTGETLKDVEYGNGMWMAGGFSSTLITSPDGVNWTDASGSFGSIYGITYGDGTFIAHGGGGTLMASSDGITWKDYNMFNSNLSAGVYAEGRFTIAGEDGVILQSVSKSGGGGGGGGCNTTGPTPGEPVWPDMLWIALLTVIFVLHRWRMKCQSIRS